MKKIMSLTKEQEALFPHYVEKWIKIGLCTEPADREKAENAINGLYRLAKLKEPKIIWLPCPISAALSSVVYVSIANSKSFPVRSAVGSAVYSAVDSAVSSALGSAVDSAVRSAVERASYAYFGASLWASYPAWADYFNEVLSIDIDRNYLDLCESSGFYWILNDVCFASERPREINLDDNGRLHNENGNSISYPSNWGLYHWHGVQVPEGVILSPELITIDQIKSERNSEVRRIMIERMGYDKYIKESNLILIDECSDDHEIIGLRTARLFKGDDDLFLLDMLNSTPEPDGSVKRYVLSIDGDSYDGRAGRECLAAMASTWRYPHDMSLFFKRPEDYAPIAES